MLAQLKDHLKQYAHAVKIHFDGEHMIKETLSMEAVLSYLERWLDNETNMINIDEDDLLVFNQMAEIDIRLVTLDEQAIQTQLPLAFQDAKYADTFVGYIDASPTLLWTDYELIANEVAQCCHEEASIVMGIGQNAHGNLQLLAFFGEIMTTKH